MTGYDSPRMSSKSCFISNKNLRIWQNCEILISGTIYFTLKTKEAVDMYAIEQVFQKLPKNSTNWAPLQVFPVNFSRFYWTGDAVRTPWTQDANWTYIRGSEHIQDVLWTSYVRSIYVLCPGGTPKFFRTFWSTNC